jgi:hypothetical protein
MSRENSYRKLFQEVQHYVCNKMANKQNSKKAISEQFVVE